MAIFLTALSRQCLALLHCTNNWTSRPVLAWTVATTFIPISSHFSLETLGLLLTSSTKLNQRMKSSFVKCLEHIWRVSPGRPPFNPLLLHEINPLLSVFACFRTIVIMEMCRTIPSGKGEHPPTTHLAGRFQVQHSDI